MTITSGATFDDVVAKVVGGLDLTTGICGTGKLESLTPQE